MPVGKLPWLEIQQEVAHATHAYMLATFKELKLFIDINQLTNFILDESNRFHQYPRVNPYPHFKHLGFKRAKSRCHTAMERMGWVRYSQHVYIVPQELNTKIIVPVMMAMEENK